MRISAVIAAIVTTGTACAMATRPMQPVAGPKCMQKTFKPVRIGNEWVYLSTNSMIKPSAAQDYCSKYGLGLKDVTMMNKAYYVTALTENGVGQAFLIDNLLAGNHAVKYLTSTGDLKTPTPDVPLGAVFCGKKCNFTSKSSSDSSKDSSSDKSRRCKKDDHSKRRNWKALVVRCRRGTVVVANEYKSCRGSKSSCKYCHLLARLARRGHRRGHRRHHDRSSSDCSRRRHRRRHGRVGRCRRDRVQRRILHRVVDHGLNRHHRRVHRHHDRRHHNRRHHDRRHHRRHGRHGRRHRRHNRCDSSSSSSDRSHHRRTRSKALFVHRGRRGVVAAGYKHY